MPSPGLQRIIVAHLRLAGEDPGILLLPFEREVREYVSYVSNEDMRWLVEMDPLGGEYPSLEEDKENVRRAYRIEARLRLAIKYSVASQSLKNAGILLFTAILQSLALPKNLRTKVEAASRFFDKRRPPIPPKKSEELVEMYQNLQEIFKGFLEVAKASLREGKAHEEGDTKLRAGPFTLVNTGNFSAETMTNVASLVEAAADLLGKKRLSKICYGDVQVTKTLKRADVLAFYMEATDEIFVRANVRKNPDTVQTLLHELGHRMEAKFLQGKEKEIVGIYRDLNTQSLVQKFREPSLPHPEKGESITIKGKTYFVLDTRYSPRAGGSYKVELATTPGGKFEATVPLASFVALRQGITKKPSGAFITPYAMKGGPSENFAEMFSYYCMNKLPEEQVRMLEPILF